MCGVVTPIIVLSLILLAVSYSPWFGWTKNALSDLGVHEAAILFNSSLMMGGVLALIFASGLMQILKKEVLGFIGTFTLALSTISLFAIGVFPESVRPIHFYVSFAFFALLAISLLLIGAALMQKPSQRYLGLVTILAGFIVAVVWSVPHQSPAIPEIIASLAASVWSVILGIKLFKAA